MKIRLEKPALVMSKPTGGKNEKPRRGCFEVENYVDKCPFQILLHKFKEEQTEVISRLSFTFVYI